MPIALFLKSHVSGYTKTDGTYVAPHDDKRNKKRIQRVQGDNVMFPHPDKPGKKALGTYVRAEGEHDVVRHEKHGEMKFHHSEVIGARGVPKSAARRHAEWDDAMFRDFKQEQAAKRE